jgi:hypothetical protein
MRRTVLAITLALLFTAVAAADDHQLPDKAKTSGKPLLNCPYSNSANNLFATSYATRICEASFGSMVLREGERPHLRTPDRRGSGPS